jgi:hypothetical protein
MIFLQSRNLRQARQIVGAATNDGIVQPVTSNTSSVAIAISATRKDVALSNQPKGGTLKPDAFLNKPFQLEPFLQVIERPIGKGEARV